MPDSTVSDGELLWCDQCQAGTVFLAPDDCPDGHGPDCPELCCTGCGNAVLTAGWPEPFSVDPAGSTGQIAVRLPGTPTRALPSTRHAA